MDRLRFFFFCYHEKHNNLEIGLVSFLSIVTICIRLENCFKMFLFPIKCLRPCPQHQAPFPLSRLIIPRVQKAQLSLPAQDGRDAGEPAQSRGPGGRLPLLSHQPEGHCRKWIWILMHQIPTQAMVMPTIGLPKGRCCFWKLSARRLAEASDRGA